MSQATDEFWAKQKELEELEQKIRERLAQLRDAVDLLFDPRFNGSGEPWQWVTVIGGGGFPSHLIDAGREVNANTLPTWQEIGQLLSRWHAVNHDYRSAWRRMTPDEQHQLSAHQPEQLKSPDPPSSF